MAWYGDVHFEQRTVIEFLVAEKGISNEHSQAVKKYM
jgi:hypothetical protein